MACQNLSFQVDCTELEENHGEEEQCRKNKKVSSETNPSSSSLKTTNQPNATVSTSARPKSAKSNTMVLRCQNQLPVAAAFFLSAILKYGAENHISDDIWHAILTTSAIHVVRQCCPVWPTCFDDKKLKKF